ncbi:DUF4369 domain-containing protein [Larkinella sp. VNQ87]|uniref:DUF4369 domain-containing protein n=1 Tax=Larkinella sp. VNQ87 TaxID=3400921 RepID=UPI003C01BCC1
MKLLQLLLLVLLYFLLIKCSAQPPLGYRVEGHIRGLSDETRMYLIDGGQRKIIDSAVVRQGRFVLAGTLTEAAHTYLYAGKGRSSTKLADILLDNRTLTIEGREPVYDSIVVTGSDIDRLWKEWSREDLRIGYQRFRIKQVYESLVSKEDTANANVLRKLINELTTARIELLKTYVRRHRTSAVGAVLPTLCTLGDYLTQADYLEMYQSLSPTWQNSRFGREILLEARRKGVQP